MSSGPCSRLSLLVWVVSKNDEFCINENEELCITNDELRRGRIVLAPPAVPRRRAELL